MPEAPADEYPCPSAPADWEERVERSRFLALARPIADPADVGALVQALRAEHHKATHHCHAWRLGHPGRQPRWGAADDGEPSGTAGLPILRAIEGSGLSDVAVVVLRWFGGVKLGTGGLARAYGSAAAGALERCPRGRRVDLCPLSLRFSYPLMTQVKRLALRHGASETGFQSGEDLLLELAVPTSHLEELERELLALFQGRGALWRS